MCVDEHMYTDAQTNTCTHTHARTHAHTHTHTHTHLPSHCLAVIWLSKKIEEPETAKAGD